MTGPRKPKANHPASQTTPKSKSRPKKDRLLEAEEKDQQPAGQKQQQQQNQKRIS
jgi:hypothetical protein